ncbi:MAG: hypothetical protein AB7U05_07165 [Mangrovibacterium sp.]
MKTINRLFILLTVLFLSSCEGEQGPPGIPGEDGINLLGSVIEIEGTFNPENDYRLYYEFPNNLEIYDSDLVLVYILWDQADNGNGNVLDIWRLVPQTVVLPEGVLQYNFDYTVADVEIFLNYTSDYSELLPAETDNQVFRIAVLPAAYAANKSIDLADMNAVMKSLKTDIASVKRYGQQ